MDFYIQASHPRYTGRFDEEDYNLSTAIETIFPMMTEDAIMVWKNIYIPLSYKYDISYMIDDVLNILESLRNTITGEICVHWASNTFANVWNIKWDNNDVVISSKWGSVVGHTEQLLEAKEAIKVSKRLFANEWKKVLYNIIKGLEESQYSEDKLPDMDRLISEYNAIAEDGILYES